ncbi:MAG TPA: tRNA uridine-5-carboxymethylaminomethyl(34) synthesis GTPase MnmE [Candidatus Kapabacteria bacterium]|nr:tRNA uridine-5-carboxymethylaminomethyl(34) synthesis GTPase MnmE [Candidatus Kapabacteria bacterium]
MYSDDTIVARATPLGTAGIAVIRMSGPAALAIASGLFRPAGYASLGDVPVRFIANGIMENDGEIVDQCLAVRFRAPHSFTGEDVVEFHLHGTMLIADRVVGLCVSRGARVATQGEFTRRAFLNGKIDLTQVEALADVLASESEQALYVAQRQLHGELRRRLDEFRERVIHLLALLELELDFVEERYRFASTEEVTSLLDELRAFVDGLLASYNAGNRLRHGPRILLLGRPNAGKSSLFNALVGYGRALVSPVEGTTRDYLEERIAHGGVQFRLVDTAGLRQTADLIEAEGVERARDLIATADHAFYLIDSSRTESAAEELLLVERMRGEFPYTSFVVVATKCDQLRRSVDGAIPCSVHDRSTIIELLDVLVGDYTQNLSEVVALVNERQFHLLETVRRHLSEMEYRSTSDTELLSADLRTLLAPIAELTGNAVGDDVLNKLFSSFCIGK